MSWQEVSLEKLKKAPWNYKTDSEEYLSKLKANIQKRGLIVNLIIRELPKGKFEVVNGNHRLQALNDLKTKEAMCFNLGKVTENQAKLIALETNEVNFKNDDIKLATILKELNEELGMKELQQALIFSDQFLKDMIAMADYKFEPMEMKETINRSGTFKTITFHLPDEVADQFQAQVRRLLLLLEKDPDGPPVSAIELMANFIAQTEDQSFGL